MNNKKDVKKTPIVKWMIQINLFSIIFVGVVLSITCGTMISKRTNEDYASIAKTAAMQMAAQLDDLSEGDYSYDESTATLYKGDVAIDDDAFKVIHNEDANLQHTIFWGNTRIMSDITDTSGASVVGSQLSDTSVSTKVASNGCYTANNVELYGKKFSVCYYPLKNSGQIVGMVFIGVNQTEANSTIIASCVVSVIIAVVLAFGLSFGVVKMIKKKSKEFKLSLNEVTTITEEKKSNVSHLGYTTNENMEQIDTAIEQVAQAVTAQASHTEEIMGSMQEFGSNIDIIMDNIGNTSKEAKESIELLNSLNSKLNKLEQVSADNSNEIVSISKQIAEDNQAVSEIVKIIDVISDIAFQITILSFNASVEAARAGEAGRGFAVVADSIKDLSDKTALSLADITKIVSTVNEKMEATSSASSELITRNDKVVSALNETRESLKDVTSTFNTIINDIADIMEKTQSIGVAKDQVVETVSSLAAASQENAAMSEEIKATTDEVINNTRGLLIEIDKLKDISTIVDDVKVMFSDTI